MHERTHRNDRPFECNICHQKFYRKEPMQKHQWRQHGIFHFKSRPNNTNANNNINNNNQLGIIGAEGVLYSTINQRIVEATTTTTSPPEEAEVSVEQLPVSFVVGQQEESTVYTQLEFLQEETVETLQAVEPVEVPEALEETVVVTTEAVVEEVLEEPLEKPMKLKMKLAQAYMKEIEESREREERRDGRGEFREEVREPRVEGREDTGDWTELVSMQRIHFNLGDIRLSSSDSSNSTHPNSNPNSNPNSRPHSRMPDHQLDYRPTEYTEPRVVEEQVELLQDTRETQAEAGDKESLEFLCKSCGTRCLVPDPYSFRCPTCNMKYTSLPTHMIADPLQCIGCMDVFAHKPALKLHQSSTDKERPFRCCKCGFEFRQKAHLQKHQWRIHRKKFEADTGVREAEALLSAVEDMTSQPPPPQYAARLEQQEATPLDLSPAKMYGTAGSINKWVEQVETARTPIIPDISIHKAPPHSPAPLARFRELLAAPPQQKESVQLRIINSLSGRQDETLTIRLVEPAKDTAPDTWERKPVAVKSKPPQLGGQVADNPLLNQIIAAPRDSSPIRTSVSISRASKRPRTDLPSSQLSHPPAPVLDTNQPADLSLRSTEARLKSPLSLLTSPLRLETEYSTVSPPLNLSSPQVSPYDYRVGKSNIISGHFQRLKSQDERSGI